MGGPYQRRLQFGIYHGPLPVAFKGGRFPAFRLSRFVTIVAGLFKFPPPGSFKFGLDGEGRPK